MAQRSTHMDAAGNARMVDVGEKSVTLREARAVGRIRMSPQVRQTILEGRAKKGDVLAVAQIAGIQAAKRTSALIPLCHPLPLTSVKVHLDPVGEDGIQVESVVRTRWYTGVEMEALTAVSVALLTVYDMVKSMDRGMAIHDVRLVEKSGGRSGHWKLV